MVQAGTGVTPLVLVTMVLSLSAVSRDSVMIGYKFQRASSGGVWGWEGGELVRSWDIPRSVGVSPSGRGMVVWDPGILVMMGKYPKSTWVWVSWD